MKSFLLTIAAAVLTLGFAPAQDATKTKGQCSTPCASSTQAKAETVATKIAPGTSWCSLSCASKNATAALDVTDAPKAQVVADGQSTCNGQKAVVVSAKTSCCQETAKAAVVAEKKSCCQEAAKATTVAAKSECASTCSDDKAAVVATKSSCCQEAAKAQTVANRASSCTVKATKTECSSSCSGEKAATVAEKKSCCQEAAKAKTVATAGDGK